MEPYNCPACGSLRIARVLWCPIELAVNEPPTPQASALECISPAGGPAWACMQCSYEWGGRPPPRIVKRLTKPLFTILAATAVLVAIATVLATVGHPTWLIATLLAGEVVLAVVLAWWTEARVIALLSEFRRPFA